MATKSAKNKKMKYRPISFKITEKQKSMIDEYCHTHHLGTVQLLKLALKEYLERNISTQYSADELIVSENQLSIFDIIRELESEEA
jgi:hypothetical protein